MESKILPFLVVSITAILLLSGVNGEMVEESKDVDIDSYIVIEIEFSSGEKMDLEAEITASNDPISLFLIKGSEDFNKWKDTEEVDIQAIMAGENVSGENNLFRVILDFSEKNTTEYTNSISIGDQDTYYLVIVIHREEGMSKEDILSRGSRVHYKVTWEEEEKELNIQLLIIAGFIGLIGIGLIIFYFKTKDDGEEKEEEPPRGHERPERPERPIRAPRERTPPPERRGRAPPMR